MFRVHVLAATLYTQLRRLIQRHGVFVAHYNTVQITEPVAQAVSAYTVILLGGFFVLTLGLAAHDLDFITSASGAAAALGNIGPGLGRSSAPGGTMPALPGGAKLLLCLGMLMGRLELFTVLVLFTPAFWRE